MVRESRGNGYHSTEKNFEEKLIDAIQKQPCLFNKSSISYRKRALKKKAWGKVAVNVGSDVKECQHRWRSLRDRFVREMRANSNCKWRYMNNLFFLKPHLDGRNNSHSVCMTDEEESCSNSEAYNSLDYEDTQNYTKSEDVPDVPDVSIPMPRFVGKIEIEDIPDELPDEIPEEIPFVSFQSAPASNSTATTMNGEVKKRRVDSESVESNDRFGMMSENSGRGNERKSRNDDYYKTLDSYMLQLPQSVQDDLKIELLNRVYNEIKNM